MRTKILVAGMACLSVLTWAQQPSGGQKASSKPAPSTTAPTAAPSDAGTAKFSGKKGYDYYKGHNLEMQHDPGASTERESPSKASTAVSIADVNGDGHAEKAAHSSSASGQSAATSNAQATVAAPRDVATGQASGKRQYKPVVVTKESDSTVKKK